MAATHKHVTSAGVRERRGRGPPGCPPDGNEGPDPGETEQPRLSTSHRARQSGCAPGGDDAEKQVAATHEVNPGLHLHGEGSIKTQNGGAEGK